MEIERKFRIRRLPESLEQYPYLQIEQGYLCTKPAAGLFFEKLLSLPNFFKV